MPKTVEVLGELPVREVPNRSGRFGKTIQYHGNTLEDLFYIPEGEGGRNQPHNLLVPRVGKVVEGRKGIGMDEVPLIIVCVEIVKRLAQERQSLLTLATDGFYRHGGVRRWFEGPPGYTEVPDLCG